jgi:hypothetical protein
MVLAGKFPSATKQIDRDVEHVSELTGDVEAHIWALPRLDKGRVSRGNVCELRERSARYIG